MSIAPPAEAYGPPVILGTSVVESFHADEAAEFRKGFVDGQSREGTYADLPGVEVIDLSMLMPDGIPMGSYGTLGCLRLVASRGSAEAVFAALQQWCEALAAHGLTAVTSAVAGVGLGKVSR